MKYLIINILFAIQAQNAELFAHGESAYQASLFGGPAIKFFFFYSEDCENCEVISDSLFPILKEKYNLQISSFEISEPQNYELLLKLEEKYNDKDTGSPENEIPVVVIGKYILGGKTEIQESLGKILEEYKQAGCDFPDTVWNRGKGQLPFPTQKRIYIAYFYDKGCKECKRVTYELKYLENKEPDIVIKSFDMEIAENKKLNEELCELYGVPIKKRLTTPIVFVGKEFLIKNEVKSENFLKLIEKYKDTGTIIPWEEGRKFKDKSEGNIKERFNKMSVLTVFSAGLIDGINPCATATIVFFVSFLSFIGKKAKEILGVGIAFTIAVFITYFFIGVGIFSVVRNFTFMPIVRKILFSGIGAFTIFLGGISIYDYFKFKKGLYGEVKLQLPGFLKKRIHTDIRDKMKMRNYILSAFIVGFLVSISEFVCTGQVYFPTITFITTQVSSLKFKSLTYLFLYNIAFICPLLVVFGVMFKGKTSTDLNLFWKKHMAVTKLVTSVLFFALGGLLIFYAYY